MSRPAKPTLPLQGGVGASAVFCPPGPWATLGAFLAARLPKGGDWAARIACGEVVDEAGRPVADVYRPSRRVYYWRRLEAEPEIPFEARIVFQDDHLLVADKPHFLPVTPSGNHLHETLLVRLKRKLGIDTLAPVHRIDRETAGLVLFSIDPATRGAYQRVFAERAAQKEYECVSFRRDDLALPLMHRSRLVDDPAHFMRMHEVAGEPNSQTRIDLIESRGRMARYRLTPLTGKRHQLRVHCAALGIPILGDRIYPTLEPADTDDHALPLQLVARRLGFDDPITGASRSFTSGFRLLELASDHQ